MEIIIDNIKYDLRTEENGAYVVENNYKGEVVIPAEIQVDGLTIPVIGIEEDAFYGCDDVTCVTLPDGLQVIEKSAFESMSQLTEIVIPDSVEYIGENAFSDCENLKKVVLPSQMKHLPADLFESCGALEEIEIPAGVKRIGDGCFAACEKLKHIVLPDGLEQIEARAFDFCESLEEIHIPCSVKEIGEAAFYSCLSLKSIVLPEGIEYVPVDCFTMCQNLEHVEIPASVKMVEVGALDLTLYKRNGIHYAHDLLVSVGRVDTPDGCLTIRSGIEVVCDSAVSDYDNTLRKVVCPSSLRQIGRDAFRDSENLEEVVLNEGLEYIDGGAFADCKKLTEIYIPSTVKRIESGVFVGCEKLEKIVVAPNNPYFDSRNDCNAVIHTESNMLVSGCCTTHIPEGVVEIGIVAFAGLKTLHSIRIPDSVTRIDWNAFNGCENLCEVVLPQNIAYVGEGAFRYTAWLKNRPKGVVVIGSVLYQYKPFYEDGREPDCAIPEGVETIAHGAFGDMNPRMRVFLPRSLKTFDPMAFGDIADYVLVRPEGVGEDYPYTDTSYCSAWIDGIFYVLDSWVKTATVVRPYERMLYRGYIVIPESVNYEGVDYRVTWIGYRAFAFDYAYGEDMFEAYGRVENACTVLETPCCVEIPASVVCIEEEAFLHCFDLRGVVLHGRHGVGRNVFDECRRLQTIVVPTELKQYYRDDELSNYWNLITDCVVQIDGISYNLDTNLMTAQVISPLADAPDYEGHVVIPEKVDYEGNAYLVDEIAHFAFFGHEIEKIDLPPSLTVIGENAFLECERLCSVDIPERVTYIGEDAFADCTNLRCVRMSEELGRKMQDYSWIGLESEQVELFAIEKQEEDTSDFDRLLDWFIEHQLNGSHTEDAQGDEAPV